MTQNSKKQFFIRLGIRICGLLVVLFGVTSLSNSYRSLDRNAILNAKYAMVEDLHNGTKAFYKDMVENEQDLIERGQLNDYKRGLSEFTIEVEKYRTSALEPRAATISFFIIDFILGIFLILGGTGLIRLRNEGRKNAIICCGIMMMVSIISFSRNYFIMSKINAVFKKTDYMNTFFYPNTEPLYLSMSFLIRFLVTRIALSCI